MLLLRTCAAAAVFATPLIAGDTTRSDELLQLIRQNECQMTAAEADEILPKHNFTQVETRDIIRAWAADGMVDVKSIAGIKLSQKGCQGG